jgi:hypothetical protein
MGVLNALKTDRYEMTRLRDCLATADGGTSSISRQSFDPDWTMRTLHQHLQSGRLRMVVVSIRYRDTTIAPLAGSRSGAGHVPLAASHQAASAPAARPLVPKPAIQLGQAIPPPSNVAGWSVEQRLKLLFQDMLPLLGKDLRAAIAAMLTGKALAELVAGFALLAGLQAIPGVGEAVDAALLGAAYWHAGWDGLRAVPLLVRSVRKAATATTTAEIAAAAPDAARALETLGTDLLTILIVHAAKRNTSGGEIAGEAEAEAGRSSQVVNTNRGQGVGARKTSVAKSETFAEPVSDKIPEKPVVADFITNGISKDDANSYLKTSDGQAMLDQLHAADPGAGYDVLKDRALGQLMSGADKPVMTPITDSLVKIVPSGQAVSPYSPYFTTPAELESASTKGTGLADQFGLPAVSKAQQYDIYKITPQESQNAFVSRVAPTLEGATSQPGGAMQYLVPNRNGWSTPELIGHITESGEYIPTP